MGQKNEDFLCIPEENLGRPQQSWKEECYQYILAIGHKWLGYRSKLEFKTSCLKLQERSGVGLGILRKN